MVKQRATVIVFEGADQTGKETQSKLLQQTLSNDGRRAIRVEVPAKACGWTYKIIYWMLKNGTAKRFTNIFQFVQFLNKWLFQTRVLPELLKNFDYVIFDRWSLSAIIYGNVTGVNDHFNLWLYKRLKKADITFIIHGTSFRRKSTTDDSYEKDAELQSKVKDAYIEWFSKHPKNHVLVRNDQTVFDIHTRIMMDLAEFGVL